MELAGQEEHHKGVGAIIRRELLGCIDRDTGRRPVRWPDSDGRTGCRRWRRKAERLRVAVVTRPARRGLAHPPAHPSCVHAASLAKASGTVVSDQELTASGERQTERIAEAAGEHLHVAAVGVSY